MKRGFRDVNVDPGEPSSSSADVAGALTRSVGLGSFQFSQRMPWELTPVLRDIFDDSNSLQYLDVSLPRNLPPLPRLETRASEVSEAKKKLEVQRRCYLTAERFSDDDRANVLLKWVDLILIQPKASRVGRQLLDELDVNASTHGLALDERSFQIVSDTLRAKSTSTLKLRANSLALFVKWFQPTYDDQPLLPLTENIVYEYVDHLRTKACAASRASTFVSTPNFAGDVLGLEGTAECTTSMRVKGAALEMYLTKRVMKQAKPLEPMMILALEIACFCEHDVFLRTLAGYCLCCIFGRLRVSDVSRLVNMTLVSEYAEGSLLRTKTARTREKQCTFLPVVVPAVGFLGVGWFLAFEKNRRTLGLQDFPHLHSNAEDRSFVVMPTKATQHLELSKKIGATEVGEGLKRLLGKLFPEDAVLGISSHSMKTTLLTYINIFGCDYTVSELLGYHVTSHLSALNYRRDALAVPIRTLMKMLQNIQTGHFDPTASRGSVFPDSMHVMPILESLETYTGKSLYELAVVFLGLDPNEGLSRLGRPDLAELWDMLCMEPRQLGRGDDPCLIGPIGSRADEVDSDDQSSSDDSDSASSSAESALAEASNKMQTFAGVRNVSDKAVLHVCYRHVRTKMLHLGNKDDDVKTACGRNISSTYDRFVGDPDRAWPHCTHCWGNFNA